MALLQRDLSTLSKAELMAMVESMSDRTSRVSFKVTEPKDKADGSRTSGGAVSVYGLGRFPVTLYASQWRRLAQEMEALSAFLTTNAPRLTEKQ